jgi:hypothetical protein
MRGVRAIAVNPRDGSRLLQFLVKAPYSDPEIGTTRPARARARGTGDMGCGTDARHVFEPVQAAGSSSFVTFVTSAPMPDASHKLRDINDVARNVPRARNEAIDSPLLTWEARPTRQWHAALQKCVMSSRSVIGNIR